MRLTADVILVRTNFVAEGMKACHTSFSRASHPSKDRMGAIGFWRKKLSKVLSSRP